MRENRIFRRIKKVLREHGLVGIYRQMHFGVAFCVIPEGLVCGTLCQRKPRSGELASTIYEEWYDMVPHGGEIEIFRQGFYGMFPWGLVLRRLKERRLAE